MLKTLPRMKLSLEEELFLRHWMFDEVHYRVGQGQAKRLQVEHRVAPADLASLIAAALSDLSDQQRMGEGPAPVQLPAWPWSEEGLAARLAEARRVLSDR